MSNDLYDMSNDLYDMSNKQRYISNKKHHLINIQYDARMRKSYGIIFYKFLSMITLYEFKDLETKEQARQLHLHGTFLDQRFAGEYTILLYALSSFYIEAYYYTISNDFLRHRAFSDTNLLDPYLKKINLGSLLI